MILTVRLKQHTPIIHFQHDQKGATLRATELKPKLDWFLKEKLYNDVAFKKFFGEKGNLPYKLSIITHVAPYKSEIEKTQIDFKTQKPKIDRKGNPKKTAFPAFFGNMGEEVEEKKFILHDNIILKFLTFHVEVIEAIKHHLCEFFLSTNFGTRQSKGFGSFYIDPSDPLCKPPSSFNNSFSFSVDTRNSRNSYDRFKILFTHIDLFYRTLRGGINLKDRNGNTVFYCKSLLFLYAKSKGWTWDKRIIKSKFLTETSFKQQLRRHPHSDILTYTTGKGYLVRDLLGVATSQAYKSEKFDLLYDENNSIQRYKSPLTFKPIQADKTGRFNVYMVLSPVDEGIFEKKFTIHKTVHGNSVDSLEIMTPPNDEQFDLFAFLRFAIKNDLSKHIDNEFHSHQNFRILKGIFKELVKNARL